MNRPLLNAVLLVLIVGSFGMSWILRSDPTQPNRRVLPNMADSVAYDSDAPNPVFADGKTLQTPPAGTIARGFEPLHYATSTEEAVRAGVELRNPFSDNPAPHLDRGAKKYATFCGVCHGSTGLGDGPVTRRGVPPPPSLLIDNAMDMPDGRMFHVLTYGQNNMASYASQISRDDRWRVILHVRSLQGKLASTQPATTTQPVNDVNSSEAMP